MTRQEKVIIRYSISFKQKVIKEFKEEGLGIAEAAQRYRIKGGGVIQKWLNNLGKIIY